MLTDGEGNVLAADEKGSTMSNGQEEVPPVLRLVAAAGEGEGAPVAAMASEDSGEESAAGGAVPSPRRLPRTAGKPPPTPGAGSSQSASL